MNSLLKNSTFNFLSQIILFISSAVLSIFFARLLGPEKMGEYSFWVWVIATGGLFLTLGIPQTLTKFISEYQTRKKTISTQIISRTYISYLKFLGAIALIAYPLILLLSGKNTVYLIISTTIFVYALNSLLSGILSGLQKFGSILKINLLISLISLIFFSAVLIFYNSLINLLAVNLILSIALLLNLIFAVKKFINFNVKKIPGTIYKEIKNYSLPVSLIVFLDLILMDKSEVFFLRNFSTLEQVAFYSISFGLVSKVMILIPGAVSGIIMPKISWLHGAGDKEAVRATYNSSSRYLMFITFPIIFAGIMLIDLLLTLLYGPVYAPAIPVIKILLISGGLSAIAAGGASVLYGTGNQNFILKLAVFAVAINLILDFLLIPQYGAIGGAFANFTAQVIGVIIGVYYLVKVKKMIFPWKDGFKIFTSGLISIIFVYLIKNDMAGLFKNPKNLILELVLLTGIFITVYFISLYAFKFFNRQDKDILNRILKKLPVTYEK